MERDALEHLRVDTEGRVAADIALDIVRRTRWVELPEPYA
jgi:hypothetical protein